MSDLKSEKKAQQFAYGALAGIAMLCVLLAKNWIVLSIGWAAMALVIVLGSLQRLKKPSPQGKPRFEVGPLIAVDPEKINRWISPVAVLMLLLGIAGLVMPLSENGLVPQYGNAVFLIGIGVACLGIGFVNRALMVTGYGLWAVAGVVMAYTALGSESPLGMAQSLTFGILLIIGGGFAAYGFLYGKTRIYEEGILLSNGICLWGQIDRWTIKTVNDISYLQVAIGTWKLVMVLRPIQIQSLQGFLEEKFDSLSQNDKAGN